MGFMQILKSMFFMHSFTCIICFILMKSNIIKHILCMTCEMVNKHPVAEQRHPARICLLVSRDLIEVLQEFQHLGHLTCIALSPAIVFIPGTGNFDFMVSMACLLSYYNPLMSTSFSNYSAALLVEKLL